MRFIGDNFVGPIGVDDRCEEIVAALQFFAKLTNRGIQRHCPVVAAIVKEQLAPVVPHRIDVDADAWRPTTRERVLQHTSGNLLLLPANSGINRNKTIHLVDVVSVGGVITSTGIHYASSVCTAIDESVNLLTILVNRTEFAGPVRLSQGWIVIGRLDTEYRIRQLSDWVVSAGRYGNGDAIGVLTRNRKQRSGPRRQIKKVSVVIGISR